jgi:hypothetical protein
VYDGEMLVFYGEGLYEDPTLGWEPSAARGVVSHEVPGDHTSNREAMMEPAVGFVSERLQAYLHRAAGDAPLRSPAPDSARSS